MPILSQFLLHIKDLFAANPPLSLPPGQFVKGINLGGAAITIDGQHWHSYESALAIGLSAPGATAITTSNLPQPYAPPALRQMLNSVIYKPQTLELHQRLVNGRYDVYLWLMENYQTNWHSLTVKLNEDQVATEVGKLSLNHWARYGPYEVEVDRKLLTVSISTGRPDIDAHLMGISLYQR